MFTNVEIQLIQNTILYRIGRIYFYYVYKLVNLILLKRESQSVSVMEKFRKSLLQYMKLIQLYTLWLFRIKIRNLIVGRTLSLINNGSSKSNNLYKNILKNYKVETTWQVKNFRELVELKLKTNSLAFCYPLVYKYIILDPVPLTNKAYE